MWCSKKQRRRLETAPANTARPAAATVLAVTAPPGDGDKAVVTRYKAFFSTGKDGLGIQEFGSGGN
jgi:hypothetical protein